MVRKGVLVMKKRTGPPKVSIKKSQPLQEYYQADKYRYSVARLIDAANGCEVFEMPLAGLDLDYRIWRESNMLELALHVEKVMDADLSKPIILDWNGCLADGRHRVIKALIEGRRTIKAVRLEVELEPDSRGR